MRIASSIAALVLLVAAAGSAHAKSAVQVDPNDSFILVNKTVGSGTNAEQWVLTLSLDDQTLIGNVFEVNGGAPTFFFCNTDTADGFGFGEPEDLEGATIVFSDCEVAGGCTALPCDPDTQWTPLSTQPANLPGEFFLP